VTPSRKHLPGCRIPGGSGACLPECQEAGICRAETLLLVDGRALVGKPLGVLGETLRFRSVFPERGPVLLSFAEVEPLSLHDALGRCTDPEDGEAILTLADVCAARGLVDLAIRELGRALRASPYLEGRVRERRERLTEEAARRGLEDAREHVEAGRPEHARAALDEVLRRFPGTPTAVEARKLRRGLVRRAARHAAK
jgi:hypothetical protein